MLHTLRSPAPDWLRWRHAYRQSVAANHLLSENRLFDVNLDIPLAARVILACMPRIRAQSRRISSNLGGFDLASIDRLDRDLQAMSYAHWLCQSTQMSFERLREWLEEWPSVQNKLPVEPPAGPPDLPTGDADWPSLEPNPEANLTVTHRGLSTSPAEADGLLQCELARGMLLAELVTILKEQGDDLHQLDAALKLNRKRAFTAFMLGYDQVRRAIHFVRWHERDAEEIAPALHRYVIRRRERHDPRSSAQFPVDAADALLPPSERDRRDTAS